MLSTDRLQQHASDEAGFSLIELLVVTLIVGVLAAIAIPSFLGQATKANDTSAKVMARTAQTAAETIATDRGGSYASITGPAALSAVEVSIRTAPGAGPYLSGVTGSPTSFSVTTTAPSGNTYTVTRAPNGMSARTCTVPAGGNPGGCTNGVW